MSLITRCPACTTMFKVVPDQLRVSDGWVRCGQCSEVFDANAHLQADSSLTRSNPGMAHVDVPPPPPPPPPPPVVVKEPVAQPVVAKAKVRAAAASVPVPMPLSEPSAPEPFLAVNPRALHLESPPIASDTPVAGSLRDLRVSPDDVAPRRPPDIPTKSTTRPPKHSFMRAASKSPSTWTRPVVRAVLSIACLVLTAGLLLQVIVQERDRIVATEPSAKPYLERVCGWLACTLSPLRQIESVVIDSSSFTKVRTDVYRLSFGLKNTALTSVATPDVELTLTDIQDQVVVRKVFTSADFGKLQTVLEAGTELQAVLPVAVKLPPDSEHIAGYRLLSFYP